MFLLVQDGALRGNDCCLCWRLRAVNHRSPDVFGSARYTSALTRCFTVAPGVFDLHGDGVSSCDASRIAPLFSQLLSSPSSRRSSFVSCSLPTGSYIIHELHIGFC